MEEAIPYETGKPMFLVDDGFQYISWETVDVLNTEVGDPNNSTDESKNIGLYDGFLKEYLAGKKTNNEKYILGVFIDRCFIPILNKETFDKIWDKIKSIINI